jgi:hypothetical protein
VLGNISRFASRTGVKEGKKEIIQISIEDVRALRKDLLADLSVWYSTLEGKISSLVNSQQQILDSPPNATRYAMTALFVIAPPTTLNSLFDNSSFPLYISSSCRVQHS